MTTDVSNYFYEYGGVAKANHVFFRNKFEIDDAKLVKEICANIDFYQTIYAYENENIDSCKLYGPLYFDLDGDMNTDEGYDAVRSDLFKLLDELYKLGLTDDDIDIYFSGNKGFHVIIEPDVLDIEPDVNLNLLYKRWALYMSSLGVKSLDLGIYDRRRLLRVEGSINGKSMLYKVRVDVDQIKDTRRSLLLYAGNPFSALCSNKRPHLLNEVAAKNFSSMSFTDEDKKQIEATKEHKDTPTYNHRNILPCVQNILDNDWPVSKRNNALYNASLSLKQNGWSYDEVVETMLIWNDNLSAPLKRNEVIDPINSVYRNSAIQQLDNAIGLRVVDTDLTGKELVSRINISPDTIAIDGKYVHITGDTLFDDDVLIKGKMVAGSIECDDGLVIHGGAATISKDGISIATSNDETISLSEHGITFSDSNGFIYSGMGRTAMGHVSATHPYDTSYSVEYHKVKFPHRMTTIPSVVIVPQQISFPESWGVDGSMYAFAPAYSCGVKDITTEGFTAWCYGSYAVPLAYSYYLNTSAAGAHPTYYRTCSNKGTGNVGYTSPMRIEMTLPPYITRIEADFCIRVASMIRPCKYRVKCDIIRASDGKKINTVIDDIPASKMDWNCYFKVNTPLPRDTERSRV